MSTTFTIIPTRIDGHVNFQNVLEIAQQTMSDFLTHYNIDFKPKFKVTIHEMSKKYVKEIEPTDRFLWTDNEYAWFNLENCDGGTDSYCESISQFSNIDPKMVEELCGDLVTQDQIQWIKTNDVYWSFRRSAGQSGLINLAYGHLAAALALLSDGIITTTDGAWDESIFPMKAEPFLKVYFRPEKTDNTDNKDWAEQCIKSMLESDF